MVYHTIKHFYVQRRRNSIFYQKGQCHEIFYPNFFFIDNLHLIDGLKPFCIWPRIRRENRQYSDFSSVIDPAETTGIFLVKFFWQSY
jgi:hypothetical protein